ncbi:hypothetical protein Aros01_00305 [Streptosporangium roseum]|uniref:Uncharacterized protein n=1 Tax=Streptosporangium roseum (strain ATCC 12428 / DSM 43021 / JCM 3005 / KCTC 9067 / NCIMB 10171 / NRRL 2505 / NI 9100) TaxID=479432 RepID=D2B8D5_STRRD|nr:hypothetical protein Sros_2970 [Streptosporangium roseum DSM 43021]
MAIPEPGGGPSERGAALRAGERAAWRGSHRPEHEALPAVIHKKMK